MYKTVQRALLLLVLSFSSHCWAENHAPVVICLDSEIVWPPFRYFPFKESGVLDRSRSVGISPQLINRVFEIADLDYKVEHLPRSRLLNRLSHYSDFESCEMSWDLTKSTEREQGMLFSLPIYKTRTGAFYSTRYNPDLGTFKGLPQLFDLTLCGLRGYDYSPINGLIKQRAARPQQALNLLNMGRCDMFISTIEPVLHGARLGIYKLGKNIDHVSASQFDSVFHAAIAKGSDRAAWLKQRVDKALQQLRASGELDGLFKRHGLPSSGL